jgi:hypothetical protein
MKTIDSTTDMQHRAEEALRSALSQVSTIKVREIRRESHLSRAKDRFVAHVEVLGRAHALACEVRTHTLAANLRKAIEELNEEATRHSPAAIPVLILPYLTPDAEAICKETRAAYIDFEGNARISLGEVFIVKRSMRVRDGSAAVSCTVASQEEKTRPPAPLVFVPSNLPASASRGRTDTAAIIGAA